MVNKSKGPDSFFELGHNSTTIYSSVNVNRIKVFQDKAVKNDKKYTFRKRITLPIIQLITGADPGFPVTRAWGVGLPTSGSGAFRLKILSK